MENLTRSAGLFLEDRGYRDEGDAERAVSQTRLGQKPGGFLATYTYVLSAYLGAQRSQLTEPGSAQGATLFQVRRAQTKGVVSQ